jgi:hypothetical protein
MATVKPDNREITIAYPKGTVTAVRGLMRYLFPEVKTAWKKPTGLTPRGRRKSYYSRRRTNAAAGQVLRLHTDQGDVWSVRVTGTPLDFINAMLASTGGEKIVAVYSERGKNFLPEPEPLKATLAAA